jgi:WD40 repeat protein
MALTGGAIRAEQTAPVPLDKLPPGALARLQLPRVSFTVHDEGPFAISPDGKTVAAIIQYSSQLLGVALHDLASGRTIPLEVDNQQPGRDLMTALAFSPDGKTLVGGNRDGDLYSWCLATGKPGSLLADKERDDRQTTIRSLAFSPDGRYLAVGRDSPRYFQHRHGVIDHGTPNATLIVRNGQTGKKLWAIEAQTGGVTAVAFSPDGQVLWSGGRAWERSDKPIRRWDIQSGQEIAWAAYGILNYLRSILWSDVVNTLAVSADGRMLVAATDRDGIQMWNVATGREARRLPGHGAWFGPDGDAIVVAEGSTLRFWDLSSQKYLRSQTVGAVAVRRAAVLPSRGVVAQRFYSGMFVLEPSGAIEELRLTGQVDGPMASARIESLAFSADGDVVASVGPDSLLTNGGSLHLWDAATGKERALSKELGGQEVRHAAFSADGTRLAIATNDSASIWDAVGARALHHLDLQPARPGWPTELVFSTDGAWLATASNVDSFVNLWNASTGSFVRHFVVPLALQNPTVAFAFSPDGMSLISATINVSSSESVDAGRRRVQIDTTTRVCVWETATGRQVSTVDIPETRLIELSPDGRLIVGASGNAFRVREVSTGREIRAIPYSRGYLTVSAFSPDSRLVALGYEDGAVHLWDVQSSTEVQRFAGHAAAVSALAFARDGSRLASGAVDGSAFVWRVKTIGDSIRHWPRGVGGGRGWTVGANMPGHSGTRSADRPANP